MKWLAAGLGLLVLGVLAVSVFARTLAPGSKPWAPRSPEGRELYRAARRDVWPSQVRTAPENYRDVTVVWSGLVKERELSADRQQLRVVLEHHYWDFIEDDGLQREKYFLSPRGEGEFSFEEPNSPQVHDPAYLPVGAMAVIFGKPRAVSADGDVQLELAWTITFPPHSFATDFWDYGRAYLEQGDQSDFKALRTF
jgi:hypothetical protein